MSNFGHLSHSTLYVTYDFCNLFFFVTSSFSSLIILTSSSSSEFMGIDKNIFKSGQLLPSSFAKNPLNTIETQCHWNRVANQSILAQGGSYFHLKQIKKIVKGSFYSVAYNSKNIINSRLVYDSIIQHQLRITDTVHQF